VTGGEERGAVATGTAVFLRRPRQEDGAEFLALAAAGRDFYRPWI